MHDVLRQRLMRRLESLPEAQIYQVLDYVEFLESKYSGAAGAEASGLQRFAEGLEDRLRRKAMNPATLREAFQVIAAADRVLSGVSNAGKQLLNEFVPEEGEGGARRVSSSDRPQSTDPERTPRQSAPREVPGSGGRNRSSGGTAPANRDRPSNRSSRAAGDADGDA